MEGRFKNTGATPEISKLAPDACTKSRYGSTGSNGVTNNATKTLGILNYEPYTTVMSNIYRANKGSLNVFGYDG